MNNSAPLNILSVLMKTFFHFICFDIFGFAALDASKSDEDKGTSLRQVLSHTNIVASLLLTAFIGTLWASIEPILEPELRSKVC